MTRTTAWSGSFEEFLAARSSALHRSAYLLTGQVADADDLLQVTLIKLYVAWSRVTSARSAEAYARRVMVNAFVSGRRPQRFTREQLVSSLPETVTACAEAEVDTRLGLWPHLAALPPRQRAVLVLRYYEDLSETEIADTLRCSAGTVKSTASAALRSLRTRMGVSS